MGRLDDDEGGCKDERREAEGDSKSIEGREVDTVSASVEGRDDMEGRGGAVDRASEGRREEGPMERGEVVLTGNSLSRANESP